MLPQYRVPATLSRVQRRHFPALSRRLTTTSTAPPITTPVKPRRSYLYVPSSSARMLEKSLQSKSDTIIYDLEDSVSPSAKVEARERLAAFLRRPDILDPERIAVRINDISSPHFAEDLAQVAATRVVRTIVLPKIHSHSDVCHVSRRLFFAAESTSPMRLIPSIESAKGLWNVGEIAGWKPKITPDHTVSALMFAAEDYCADTSVLRTLSRRELLYARSKIVVAAKAYGLDAIDMVCVNFHDNKYLKEECQDGRELGFTGKQAIHPDQVDIIQSTFVPSAQEIHRAAKIVHRMKLAHASHEGVFGLELAGGRGQEMIDAPMLKQAIKIISLAEAAGLDIPDVEVAGEE